MVKLKFTFGKFLIHSEYGEPHAFSLPLDILDVRSHQALLKNFIPQNFIEVFAEAKKIPQPSICVHISYYDSEDLSGVIKPELLETIASFEQRTCDHLSLREHTRGNLLVALKLREKNVHL